MISKKVSRKRDAIYAHALKHVEEFRFDEKVARVFSDMIRRSVPGYESVLPMTAVLAHAYAREGTFCYDLGSSLGATTLAFAQGIGKKKCRGIIAVDNSPAMVRESRSCLDAIRHIPVYIVCGDVRDLRIRNASLVALNYTLQFLPPADRKPLLRGIYDGLDEGGALIISEKIRFGNDPEQEIQTGWHHTFKRYHGYSNLEISQKRTALENTLIPETAEDHRARLYDVGFRSVYQWFQCFNFISVIALK